MKTTLTGLQNIAHDMAGRMTPTMDHAFMITLQGDLGAGKTTFVQALAREIGVTGTVQSPTFALMKIYKVSWRGFERFIHIDAYRLNGAREFAALAPETFLNDPHAVVCVEWPEQIEGALPSADIVLSFSHIGADDEREVVIR